MDNQLKIELSPPWETYASELKALFENDDEVKVLYDHDNYTVRIYVDNTDKAEALKELMNEKIEIGNVTLAIDIIPSNNGGGITLRKNDTPWLRAFSGNSNFVGNESIHYPSVGTLTYVIWSATPAQFFNDNLGDWFGNKTILFEDIARRVFVEQPGVFHCSARMKHDYLTIH